MSEASLGFDFFVHVVDCQGFFVGEDVEDCTVKSGFSTFEN